MTTRVDPAREALLRIGPNPEAWILWPLLPVKKATDPFVKGGLGYVREDGANKIHVYEGCVFALKDSDPVIASYDTWLAMADDGWVID